MKNKKAALQMQFLKRRFFIYAGILTGLYPDRYRDVPPAIFSQNKCEPNLLIPARISGQRPLLILHQRKSQNRPLAFFSHSWPQHWHRMS